MALSRAFSSLLTFAARNERKLGAIFFAFGFILDLFTFGLLPFSVVNYFFITYLVLAAVGAIGAHYFAGAAEQERQPWWRRALSVVLPLLVQYAFGGLLSGFFVFYAAHSFLAASWPFILILAVFYIGNEYLRMYKHYLVFQTTLFFFALYAYAIFALPLYTNTIGPFVFAGSTFSALVLFALFVYLLRLANRTRLKSALRQIGAAVATIVVVVSASYAFGLIPPVPLTLADSGIYHSLSKVEGGYLVLAEEAHPWWNPFPEVVHHVPGGTLYAYSAIAAPFKFSASVVHRWERNVEGKGWVTVSRVSFPISGGREGGYRGYSYHSNLPEGKWRVSVETTEGQVIGRMRFDIEEAGEAPALHEERL